MTYQIDQILNSDGWKGSFQLTHPQTQHQVTLVAGRAKLITPAVLMLICSPIYFAYHKAWKLAGISLVTYILTVGYVGLVFAFIGKKLLIKDYLKRGYEITAYASSGTDLKEQGE